MHESKPEGEPAPNTETTAQLTYDVFNFDIETRNIILAYNEGVAMLRLFDGCRADNFEFLKSMILQDPPININWLAGAEEICIRLCNHYHGLCESVVPSFFRSWHLLYHFDEFLLELKKRQARKVAFNDWLVLRPDCILIHGPIDLSDALS